MIAGHRLKIDADLRLGIGPASIRLRGEDSRLQADVARLRDLAVLWKHRRQCAALVALARRFGVRLGVRVRGCPVPGLLLPG